MWRKVECHKWFLQKCRRIIIYWFFFSISRSILPFNACQLILVLKKVSKACPYMSKLTLMMTHVILVALCITELMPRYYLNYWLIYRKYLKCRIVSTKHAPPKLLIIFQKNSDNSWQRKFTLKSQILSLFDILSFILFTKHRRL